MTTATLPTELMLRVHETIDIDAPIAAVWEALLEQIGPSFDRPDGGKMPAVLEPWPGGRWYRDLGNNTGHFWGHVQVIKPPALLEITGPMFMSYPVASHIQYRLKENGKGTHLELLHRALGDILPEHRAGVSMGWKHLLSRIGDRSRR
jgi:uncharacterized protein YndB with AHSA1/START domain